MSKLNVGNDNSDNNTSTQATNADTQVTNASTNQYLKVNYNNSIKDLLVPTKDTLDQLKESGVVYSAKKLETGTNLNTDLSKTDPFNFDGSTETGTLGVTGTLPIEHGGTGRPSRDSAYSNLMSGGLYKGNLNDAQNAGVYMFTTADTTNYPTYAGRADNWARLEVTTSIRDSAGVMQRVIYSSEGVEFTRLHANGTTWTPWQIVVSGAVAHRQFVQSIPSGANLNDYMINGSYVSSDGQNVIANLPPFFGDGKGAFTLFVTGITTNTAYTNQILITIDNRHIYTRSQTNWQSPWTWTDWTQIITTNIGGDYYAQLRSPNNLIHAGNEFTFAAPQISNDIWLNYRTASGNTDGNIEKYLFGNGKGGLASISADGIYAGNNLYGTSLPAAGSKGRIFFKKV